MKNIKIISVMSELGAGTRGSSLAFSAILSASLKLKSDFFNKFPVEEIENENHYLFNHDTNSFAKNIDGIIKIYARLARKIKSICINNNFPIVISGDHSSAGGIIEGLKASHPNKKLGVIWIDAHADLHSPLTTPSGNMHGMPLSISLNDDNSQSKINIVEDSILKKWKILTGKEKKILAENLIFFGVRDTEKQEDEMMSRLNLRNYSIEEIRTKGIQKCVFESLQILNDCELIYVSFDVDSLDSSISKGTGTPVSNGFTVSEIKKILKYFFMSEKICCFEITEVNPTLDDKGNKMAETAFEILEKTISNIS